MNSIISGNNKKCNQLYQFNPVVGAQTSGAAYLQQQIQELTPDGTIEVSPDGSINS